jgi:FtsP/CotA-like multicopper oxidase with cupredoxin domain
MATARQGSWKLNFPPDERLSASLNIDAKIDIEESAELMRDEEAIYKTHDYPSCSGWEKRKGDRSYGYGDGSRWLKPLGLAFALFSLVTILITSSTKLAYSSGRLDPLHLNTDLDEDSKTLEEILGIRLHPQDHVDRAPKTITHHWKVTSGIRSPDGVKKEVYLVNDQFPGPTIECRSGDRLIIHVTNSLKPGEPVSIHWHGLHVANRMDGAAGFTQCPIPSGKKFIYEFDVPERQSGTFWWHAHSGIQKGDGMYGGLVVHKPVSIENEMEMYGYTKEVLLLIGDWYHRSAGEILDWYMSSRGFGNEVSRQ